MKSSRLDFLRNLVADVPVLNVVLNRSLQKWEAGTPPNTLVFSEIGDAIASNLATFPSEVRRKIFLTIEEGIVSQDVAVSTAVATGLVEALVANADRSPDLWENLEQSFGTASLKHAMAWRNFGN